MLSVILQAGGKSTRMGKDKALLPFLGIPLIQRLKERFITSGSELLVISNTPDAYQFLEIPVYQDLIPERGALGGLYTALKVSSQPLVGLIAADLPFASSELLLHLKNIIQESESDAVIPSSDRALEPLHAVYRVESCLPLVKKALDNDLWRMIAWHDQAKIEVLNPSQTQKISGSEHTFFNLNTPEDFLAAESIARKRSID
jgi:molybdopterin-guanine dinucleotide biosynthesis protein A